MSSYTEENENFDNREFIKRKSSFIFASKSELDVPIKVELNPEEG